MTSAGKKSAGSIPATFLDYEKQLTEQRLKTIIYVSVPMALLFFFADLIYLQPGGLTGILISRLMCLPLLAVVMGLYRWTDIAKSNFYMVPVYILIFYIAWLLNHLAYCAEPEHKTLFFSNLPYMLFFVAGFLPIRKSDAFIAALLILPRSQCEALNMGADIYLAKPMSRGQFFELLLKRVEKQDAFLDSVENSETQQDGAVGDRATVSDRAGKSGLLFDNDLAVDASNRCKEPRETLGQRSEKSETGGKHKLGVEIGEIH